MTLEPFLAWGLFTVLGLLAAVFAASQARVALRRRARRLHYLQAAAAERRAHAFQSSTGHSISPEQVASISSDAQQAAWRVARHEDPPAANPHPARTREFVLWEATFHSALSDFTELAEDAQHAVQGPAPRR